MQIQHFFQIITLIITTYFVLTYQFYFYHLKIYSSTELIFEIIPPSKKICWIFDENATYKAMLSLFSITLFNPDTNFDFYFIIPQNMTLNLSNYSRYITPGSNIFIKHFHHNHTFLPLFSKRCSHSGIIIVKLFLYQILPTIDKILYLDTDMINFAPISQIWDLKLEGKTLAASFRDHYKWINSGFVFYNLDYIRKKPQTLWECIAKRRVCYVDDIWHTYCHNRSEVIIVPYRYNVDASIIKQKLSRYYIREISNPVFLHMFGLFKPFFSFVNRDQLKNMTVVNGSAVLLKILNNVYSIKEMLDKNLSMPYFISS